MKLPRFLTAALLGMTLCSGIASADPVLEPPTQSVTTYYYTSDAVRELTGIHFSPCQGLPYWVGDPGPVEEVVIEDC